METNLAPSLQLGDISELPAFESEPLGAFFLDTSSGDLYVNEDGGWALVARVANAIGTNLVAFGNGAGGITADSRFSYDPATDTLRLNAEDGSAMLVADGAARTVTVFSPSGNRMLQVSTAPGAERVIMDDQAGVNLFAAISTAGNERLVAGRLLTLVSLTLAEANALPPAVLYDGSMVSISDGRKPGELGPPTGTVGVYYASGGWYNPGTNTLVTN